MNEELRSDMSPESINQTTEGTDIDAAFSRVQDEKRLNEAYGVEPGKLATDEQLQGMKDHQEAMNAHEERIAERQAVEANGEEFFINKDRPLDSIQEKQAEQGKDLEYLTSLFRESSDKEHQVATWQLFDEFVNRYSMNRDAERALRNHFIGIRRDILMDGNQKEPALEKNSSGESTPEVPIVAVESVEPVAGEEKAEGSEDKTQEGESTPEVPIVAIESVEPDGTEEETETPEAEEDIDSDETVRKSIWQRFKEFPNVLAFKIDQFFNGGTPEQNEDRKNLAKFIGIAVVATAVLFGLQHYAKDLANAAQSGVTPDKLPTPETSSLIAGSGMGSGVISGAQETLKLVPTTLTEQLSYHGDTVWYHAENILKQWGVNPSKHNIWILADNILKNNGSDWLAAHRLHVGDSFTVSQSLRSLFP